MKEYMLNLGKKAKEAAEALRLTAQDLKHFGVIDEIITEPVGGAHRDMVAAIEKVDETIYRHLQELMTLSGEELKKQRNDKILEMGHHIEVESTKG